ncbi:MAG: serine/threonine-protein kinase, partial [Vicinamibacteria bacterium]
MRSLGMPSAHEMWKQFKLVEPLGKGGMGQVFLAEDTALDRKVALKFLPAALEEDRTARERFLREAKAAAALDHPYICKIYEIGEVEGKAYIAMEYIEGTTLLETIGSGPLPLARVLDLGAEIAEALEAAHKKQIVHRDIKSANVMVTPEGHVKILDFGLARMLAMEALSASKVDTYSGRLSSHDSTPGTVIYMSPEQVRGEPIDGRTDIFSLGVVLYEMATANLPFQGATSGLIYDAILNLGSRPPSYHNPRVPPDLDRIILKTLEKDRDHRYQNAKDLMVDLKRLKRDTDATAVRPDSSLAAPGERVKMGWVALVAAAGLLV